VIGYLRSPKAIYARSFAIIREEADFSGLPEESEAVVTRIIHACGITEITRDLRISGTFCAAASAAIGSGRPILVDAEMVRYGIIRKSLNVICTLNDPLARDICTAGDTTRSAAAVELWRPHLDGAVAVIGNAPTALFELLAMIDGGAPRPAAIVGFPVGFVGAVESKAELHANPRGIPYATLLGRKGGSAMAAAVVNALTQGEAW
jgi:precorrin-8X/cobalt-precorrin-8 methylmutase